jgi:hypothetical protein
LRLSEGLAAGNHIDGFVGSVDLFADGQATTSILRVIVTDCLNRMAPCYDLRMLRQVCDRLASFPFGNRTAYQCVNSGRAACHWGAYVLLRDRMVHVMTMATDGAANEAGPTRSSCADGLVPAMRAYPLEAMFSSFCIPRAAELTQPTDHMAALSRTSAMQ